jgi:MoaD family protein
MFASAREAAGRSSDTFEATTVGEVVAAAVARYGEGFGQVVETSRIWVNGDEPADGPQTRLTAGDEVAILPPVSGGC